MKTVGDLIDYLETIPADVTLKGVVEYDEKKQELLMKRSSRKTTKPNVKVDEVRDLMEDPEARFNYRQLLLAWGILYNEVRGTNVTINFPRDTGILKNTFPLAKDFGHSELNVLRTYLEIFDKQIKTSSYKQPTLGGLRYAMGKINQAMAKQKVDNLKQKNKHIELSEEVF